MIKGIFSLSLRALEGFLNSLFTLMNVPLTSPDYTSISKRAKTVNVQYRNKIAQVSADGAYDTKGCYQLLRHKGCKATIPPRSNAGLWEPRNEAVEALKAGQLKQWKIDNGYHQRSLAETAMGRYKQLNSPMLSLRDYNGQLQRHWPV